MNNNNKLLAFISLVLSLSIIFAGTNVYAETTFEKIKRTGKVTVGTEAAFPPFEFVEDGKIVGYGKDILDYIIADMGVELNQLDLPWQGILPGVLAGKFDFVATSVSIRAERAKKYAFTVPIAEGTNWVMKRSGDSSIMSPDDLSGKVVCTQLASGSEKATKEWETDMKSWHVAWESRGDAISRKPRSIYYVDIRSTAEGRGHAPAVSAGATHVAALCACAPLAASSWHGQIEELPSTSFKRGVANLPSQLLPNFGGPVLGCIETDVCKTKLFVLQHV